MNTVSSHSGRSIQFFNHSLQQFTQTPFRNVLKPKKILMIEDDIEMANLITSSLKNKYLCVTHIAQDPFEAMNLMTDNYYDLIILDWQLPGLTGKETLQQAEKSLKLEPSLPLMWGQKRIPVVVFSSSLKNECLLQKTKFFNYVGHILKSQKLDTLVSLLSEFIDESKNVAFKYA